MCIHSYIINYLKSSKVDIMYDVTIGAQFTDAWLAIQLWTHKPLAENTSNIREILCVLSATTSRESLFEQRYIYYNKYINYCYMYIIIIIISYAYYYK